MLGYHRASDHWDRPLVRLQRRLRRRWRWNRRRRWRWRRSGSGNQAQQQQQQPAQEKEQPAQEKQANEGQNKSYGIGDAVPVGDVSYRVTGAKRVRQLPDPYRIDSPMKGNFILITFVFTNNGNEAANVSDIGLYLYDSQNREFETDTDAAMNLPQDKSIFLLDRVNPGLSRTVQTVYSVPPDAKGFELEVTSGFWATESARISLGF
jgi:biotin carboxyl carrier protein